MGREIEGKRARFGHQASDFDVQDSQGLGFGVSLKWAYIEGVGVANCPSCSLILDFEVTMEKQNIDCYFIVVPLRSRHQNKAFKCGTPRPSIGAAFSQEQGLRIRFGHITLREYRNIRINLSVATVFVGIVFAGFLTQISYNCFCCG